MQRQCMRSRLLLASLGCTLAGCSPMMQVQTLATGRTDVSAYMLTGGDLDALRREAQALCPLGGDIVRQFGQQQRPEVVGGRWRSTVNAAAQWVDPPAQTAQLVLVCREPGERFRLQVAAAPPAPASAADAIAPEIAAALPVGPITPEW